MGNLQCLPSPLPSLRSVSLIWNSGEFFQKCKRFQTFKARGWRVLCAKKGDGWAAPLFNKSSFNFHEPISPASFVHEINPIFIGLKCMAITSSVRCSIPRTTKRFPIPRKAPQCLIHIVRHFYQSCEMSTTKISFHPSIFCPWSLLKQIYPWDL